MSGRLHPPSELYESSQARDQWRCTKRPTTSRRSREYVTMHSASAVSSTRNQSVQLRGRWLRNTNSRINVVRHRSIAMSASVCLLVCLCVCVSASSSPELHIRSSSIFWGVLPMSMTRSSSRGAAMGDKLPVVRMTTSYLNIMSRTEACRYRCSEWRHCVVVRRLTPLLLRRVGWVVS